jgi:predicted Zn finger-like uncharacterized protein
MILTCPQCATGYLVEDGQIKAGGRWVKCASCGRRWLAKGADADPRARGGPGNGPAAVDSLPPEPAAKRGGDAIPMAFRARVHSRRRLRRAALAGAGWGGALVALALLLGAAAVFRLEVVRAWPGAAATYAAVGLPVNRLGLVIEQVRAEPTLALSHAALFVTGSIRNVQDRMVRSPPLRIVLYNARGKRVAGEIAVPADPKVPPGRTRRFAVTLLDPPLTAYALEVGFAPESARRFAVTQPVRPPPPAPAPSSPGLRGAVAPAPNG